MGKRVIITGASGFVGANLTRRLIAEGHEVYLFLRPNCQTWRLTDVLEHVSTRFVQLEEIESLFQKVSEIKPNWIFHLAASGSYSYQNDWREMVDTNMLGTINMLECAAKIEAEVFVNTGCFNEYGFASSPACETQSVNPNSYYSITKVAQTMTGRHFASSKKLAVPTLRLYTVYGPWQDPQQLMPNLILHGLEGSLPPRVEAQALQDYVYVDDVVDAYLKAATKPVRESGPVFNVGTGIQTSTKELIDISMKEFDLKKNTKLVASSKSNSASVADITKARKMLDWYPAIDLEVGFKKFATWFKENPEFIELYEYKLAHFSAKI